MPASTMSAIRLARTGDLPAIEEIVHSAYARYVPLIGQKPGPMLDDYAALIQGRHVYVLSDGHELAGIIVLVVEGQAMLLDNVAVHPRFQGRGLGRALMAFAENVSREKGLSAIRLYTNEAMTENIGLYRALGFVETHRGEEKGFRRVYMTKPLDAPS
jgi:ribosomal protein S18 acetylase RimI-like enzyme